MLYEVITRQRLRALIVCRMRLEDELRLLIEKPRQCGGLCAVVFDNIVIAELDDEDAVLGDQPDQPNNFV